MCSLLDNQGVDQEPVEEHEERPNLLEKAAPEGIVESISRADHIGDCRGYDLGVWLDSFSQSHKGPY